MVNILNLFKKPQIFDNILLLFGKKILLIACQPNLLTVDLSLSFQVCHTHIQKKKKKGRKAYILVSCGCCNKLPQTWWLKTIHIQP